MKPGMTIVFEQSITSASAVDQDVGLLEVTHLPVECEDDAAAQKDAALAGVAYEVLRL